jgi:hypothetical protein
VVFLNLTFLFENIYLNNRNSPKSWVISNFKKCYDINLYHILELHNQCHYDINGLIEGKHEISPMPSSSTKKEIKKEDL